MLPQRNIIPEAALPLIPHHHSQENTENIFSFCEREVRLHNTQKASRPFFSSKVMCQLRCICFLRSVSPGRESYFPSLTMSWTQRCARPWWGELVFNISTLTALIWIPHHKHFFRISGPPWTVSFPLLVCQNSTFPFFTTKNFIMKFAAEVSFSYKSLWNFTTGLWNKS